MIENGQLCSDQYFSSFHERGTWSVFSFIIHHCLASNNYLVCSLLEEPETNTNRTKEVGWCSAIMSLTPPNHYRCRPCILWRKDPRTIFFSSIHDIVTLMRHIFYSDHHLPGALVPGASLQMVKSTTELEIHIEPSNKKKRP